MTLQGLIEKARSMKQNIPAIIGSVLRQHDADIMELQRIQLLEGHDSNEKDLRPSYTDDIKPQGYFNSRESAGRYAAWKESLDYPYTVKRNTNAPNLYINGRFHNELSVKYGNDSLSIVPATSYASRIVSKYGINSFGLSMEKWNNLFNERGAKEEIINKFKKYIYE